MSLIPKIIIGFPFEFTLNFLFSSCLIQLFPVSVSKNDKMSSTQTVIMVKLLFSHQIKQQ